MSFPRVDLCAILQVSDRRLRYLRDRIPALVSRRGKEARFTVDEAVALMVLDRVMRRKEADIDLAIKAWRELIDRCSPEHWESYRNVTYVLDRRTGSIHSIPWPDDLNGDGAFHACVLPLLEAAKRVHQWIFESAYATAGARPSFFYLPPAREVPLKPSRIALSRHSATRAMVRMLMCAGSLASQAPSLTSDRQ